ncbi:MAG: right-handed parallel beta-helix repeat-containing protein [Sedimentisphaeraceae bacterium JB056]
MIKRILLVTISISVVCFSQTEVQGQDSLEAKRQYLLSFANLLDYSNRFYFGRLEVGDIENPFEIEYQKKQLDDWWGIKDRNDLLETLRWLVLEGSRSDYREQVDFINSMSKSDYAKSLKEVKGNTNALYRLFLAKNYPEKFRGDKLIARDLARAVSLVRRAYTAGYISKNEGFRLIEGFSLYKRLTRQYESWDEYADHYLVGRNYWSYENSDGTDKRFNRALNFLRESKYSPWTIYKDMKSAPCTLPSHFRKCVDIEPVDIRIIENTINIFENHGNPENYSVEVNNTEQLIQVIKDGVFNKIFIKSGKYIIDEQLQIGNNKHLIGENRDKTLLIFKKESYLILANNNMLDSISFCNSNSKSNIMVTAAGAKNTVKNCVFNKFPKYGLYFYRGKTNTVENCVFVENKGFSARDATDFIARDCLFENCTSTAFFINNSSGLINNNVITNSKDSGIYCNNSDVHIINNISKNNKGFGISAYKCNDKTRISNNITFGNKDSGIVMFEANSGLITGNKSWHNGMHGIQASDMKNIVIEENIALRNFSSGFSLFKVKADFTQNQSVDNKNSGIVIEKSSIVLTDNEILLNRDDGISIQEAKNIIVKSNTCKWNMFSGIRIIKSSKDIKISDNHITENCYAGIKISCDENIEISGNRCTDNGAWAVVLSDKNLAPKIENNVFTGNFQGDNIKIEQYDKTYLQQFEEFKSEMGI